MSISSFALSKIGEIGLISLISKLPHWIKESGPDFYRSLNADSLIEFTESTRVEPISLVDHTIADLPVMNDLHQSLTALYASYYLQAAAISAKVNDIKVMNVLEKLNPSRKSSELFGLLESRDYNTRNTDSTTINPFTLPGFETTDDNTNVTFTPSNEAAGDVNKSTGGIDKKSQDQIANMALNLSTGLLLSVNITVDEYTAQIPVTVRLITTITTPELLIQMATHSAKDKSLKARWRGYKTGELNLKELMFATDLIDAHRKGLMEDDTGKYAEIYRRKNKNRLMGLLTGNPSVSTASNIMVISKDTLKDIELEVGGDIDNEKIRDRIFKDTYLIFLVIVDEQWEKITIYHRGIKLPTELDFRAVKSASKGGNTDVLEYFKQYQQQQRPTF